MGHGVVYRKAYAGARIADRDGIARRLGLRLRQLREDRGFTQESMASRTGIDPKTYQGYENGTGDYKSGRPFNPKLNTLMALASGLDLSMPQLVAVLFEDSSTSPTASQPTPA